MTIPFPHRFLRPRRLLGLACACTLAACAGKGLKAILEPDTGPGAVYALLTFNGKPTPVEIVSNSTKLEIKKGALTLGTDSTWILSYVVRQSTTGGEQNSVVTTRGLFSLTGTAIRLRLLSDSLTRLSGTYSPTDVTLTDLTAVNGDRLAFHKN